MSRAEIEMTEALAEALVEAGYDAFAHYSMGKRSVAVVMTLDQAQSLAGGNAQPKRKPRKR